MDFFRAPLTGVTAAVLCLAAAGAQAEPMALAYNNVQVNSDPLGRLLAERGWTQHEAVQSSRTAEEALQSLVAAAHPLAPGKRPLGRVNTLGSRIAAVASAALPDDSSLTQQLRGRAAELVRSALTLMGVPYRNGGVSAKTGFDCSGFTRHVFERIGIDLPRLSREQAQAPIMTSVKRSELQPGDLVFFNTVASAFSHVGIYLGDNKFIHAPRTGGRVRVEDLRVAYWTSRFDGGRRASAMGEPVTDTEVSSVPATPQP